MKERYRGKGVVHSLRANQCDRTDDRIVSNGQFEDLPTSLPTRDHLRLGVVDWKNLNVFLKLLNIPLRNLHTLEQWSIRCETLPVFAFLPHQIPLAEPVSREFDAPMGESPAVPVTMETSPRELTLSQG